MAHMDPSWVMIPSAAFGFAGGNPWCSNAQKKTPSTFAGVDVAGRLRAAWSKSHPPGLGSPQTAKVLGVQGGAPESWRGVEVNI